MDAQIKALRDELDAALADLDEAGTLAEINQTLVELLDFVKSRKEQSVTVNVEPTPIQNNVTVSPTPITNVVNMERCSYEVVPEYGEKNRVVKMTVTPITKGT